MAGERWSLDARPVPFPPFPDAAHPSLDAGLYLRTDFWVKLVSGGSYGHTCYVAKELAAGANRFACLLPQRYDLLDTLGVPQAIMDPPPQTSNDRDLRARVAEIQQTLDRLLTSTGNSTVGTTGTTNDTGDMVTIDRASLARLRQQVEALAAAIERR